MIKKSNSDHYLTDEQLEYFRGKLLSWKMELIKECDDAREFLADNVPDPDSIDSACSIATQAFELRTKDRARKLIHKIDAAIARIDNGTYGYCEETGKPIGIQRLEARPVASLCIEAQEMREKMEKAHREGALDERR
jgi:DnaK suppressor protein